VGVVLLLPAEAVIVLAVSLALAALTAAFLLRARRRVGWHDLTLICPRFLIKKYREGQSRRMELVFWRGERAVKPLKGMGLKRFGKLC